MMPLDRVLQEQGDPKWQRLEVRLLFVALAFFLWAYFAEVDRVVTAPGQVIPFDKVKVVQHLEGGIIEHLYVRDNSVVKAGQPLLELNLSTSAVNTGELTARISVLEFSKKRLLAESKGSEKFVIENQVVNDLYKDALNAEFSTFEARLNELKGALTSLFAEKDEAEKRVLELEARNRALKEALNLAEEQKAISESLVKDQLVSKLEHYTILQKVEGLKGDIASNAEAINGAKASVNRANSKIVEEKTRYQRRASDELNGVEAEVASLKERLVIAKEQAGRSVVKAPIDGVVKNLKYQSLGNVVKAGEPIMEIVPEKEKLVVELKLQPSDRGFVTLEQPAMVKITAYDFYRYGGIDGVVTEIAADTDTDREQNQFYKVIIETENSFVGEKSDGFDITPGMTADVAIKVSTQSVLWALIRPILRIKDEALQET
jgi:adhesin transport system membrane fusion protein